MKTITESMNQADAAPRPRYREFRVDVLGDEIASFGGPGWTLDRVIEQESLNYEESFKFDVDRGVKPEEYCQNYHDQVVWEGRRVVAILHPEVSGTLRVTRVAPEA